MKYQKKRGKYKYRKEKNKFLFSIIVPVYNTEKYVEKTLKVNIRSHGQGLWVVSLK